MNTFDRVSKILWSLALALLLLVVGCTSLHKKAEKYYEAGAYQESIDTYDEILHKDPKDSDAIIGRLKARQKLIDTKLIEVRRSRMAGNEENAIEMLLHLVTQEDQWGVYPKGAVAYTQDEESGEGLKYVDHEVKDALETGFPLRSSYLLRRYSPIFKGDLDAPYQRISAVVRDSGKQRCQAISAEVTASRPYFAEFALKYCAHWGLQPQRVRPDRQRKLKELYRGIVLKASVENLPPDVVPLLQDSVEEGMKKTPWFDAQGSRVLKILLNGKYVKNRREETEVRVHSYTVQIPYTSYEPMQKERQVSYTDYEYRCDPISGSNCTNVPVTRFRTEQYTEIEPVTRYRDEPRTQTYDGMKISQLLSLSLEGKAQFEGTMKTFGLNDKIDSSGFESEWNLPDIGLYPQRADVPESSSWLKVEALQLGDSFEGKADELWEHYYCQPIGNQQSLAAQGEQVHRCLRRKPSEVPRFISLWYENTLGVTFSQADEILGLKDL